MGVEGGELGEIRIVVFILLNAHKCLKPFPYRETVNTFIWNMHHYSAKSFENISKFNTFFQPWVSTVSHWCINHAADK